jgi:hypothetical protein
LRLAFVRGAAFLLRSQQLSLLGDGDGFGQQGRRARPKWVDRDEDQESVRLLRDFDPRDGAKEKRPDLGWPLDAQRAAVENSGSHAGG